MVTALCYYNNCVQYVQATHAFIMYTRLALVAQEAVSKLSSRSCSINVEVTYMPYSLTQAWSSEPCFHYVAPQHSEALMTPTW